jgi:hypothetical protein
MGIRLNYLYLVASFAISSRHDVDDSKAACRTKVSVAGQRRFPCIQGSDNACYKISADEEDCPADGKHVRSQPVSSDIDETKEGWDLC